MPDKSPLSALYIIHTISAVVTAVISICRGAEAEPALVVPVRLPEVTARPEATLVLVPVAEVVPAFVPP
jgi:hypothetical protein